jgi:hypothetical protein
MFQAFRCPPRQPAARPKTLHRGMAFQMNTAPGQHSYAEGINERAALAKAAKLDLCPFSNRQLTNKRASL